MLFILSCSSEIYFFVFMLLFFVLRSKISMLIQYYFCKNTSLLTGGSLTHETSAGARTGIVPFPDWHRPLPGLASSLARTGIVPCPDWHRPLPGRASADLLRDFGKFLVLFRHHTMPGRSPLKLYNFFNRLVPVRSVQTPAERRLGTMSFYPQ